MRFLILIGINFLHIIVTPQVNDTEVSGKNEIDRN